MKISREEKHKGSLKIKNWTDYKYKNITPNPVQVFMKFHIWIMIKKIMSESFRGLKKQICGHTSYLKRVNRNYGCR